MARMANRSPRKATPSTKMTTVIIGGGWSGLAAAITLCQQGKKVHVIEAAKQLGGRARNVSWNDKVVDNGQHLMIGAYQHMLNMMRLINIDETQAFDRTPIDISIYDTEYPELKLSAKHYLPWPLSLAWSIINSGGISAFIAIARLQKSIPKILKNDDQLVDEWLKETNQPARLIKQLWEPLCLATLNTPINEASAHLLATVIKDSLGQQQKAADLLIPKLPLGDLFPSAAANYINQQGGTISLHSRATELIVANNQVTGVMVNDQLIDAENIIVATAPSAANKLISKHIDFDLPKQYPIITVYLQYSVQFRLNKPMFGLSGTLSQWVFDRSEQQAGLIAIVISAPGKHEKMTNDELATRVIEEMNQTGLFNNEQPREHLIIREKRATFAALKNAHQNRPDSATTVNGLWLAGDYVVNPYPATLEGAIINGKNCAEHILQLL